MSTELQPGDRAYYLSAKGLKLRCVVADALNFGKTRGEELLVPVTRAIERKKNRCNIDSPSDRIMPRKLHWIERSKLRKLPSK